MDKDMTQLLVNFHVSANKGGLHPSDKLSLFDFISHAADSFYQIDDIINWTFKYLTETEHNPWTADLARNLMKDIRFGVELLRHLAGREE